MKKGDKIEVLDDALSGKVISVKKNVVTIETTDGFQMQFDKKELVVVSEIEKSLNVTSDTVIQAISEKEEKRPKKPVKSGKRKQQPPPMEVDLHIHQLVKHFKYMQNHEMLTLQLDTAKRQLDFAIAKRIQRVVFIHGVGVGVLRTELEYLFRRYENIKYYDANYQKYGAGATEVYIFQKAQV